jgi:hypothetical protein
MAPRYIPDSILLRSTTNTRTQQKIQAPLTTEQGPFKVLQSPTRNNPVASYPTTGYSFPRNYPAQRSR